MRRFVFLLAIFALIAVSCGPDNDTSEEPNLNPSPAEVTNNDGEEPVAEPADEGDPDPVELTASYQGVTPDTIRIGLLYPDLEAIRDLINIDHGDYGDAYQLVVDAINDEGGINGRQIETVVIGVNPIDPIAADNACVTLVDDHELFAVVGRPFEDQVLCYVELSDMAFVGGVVNSNRAARATAPWFTPGISSEREAGATVAALIAGGEFDDATLGVVVSGADQAVLDDVVKPILAAAGIGIASEAVLDTSSNDPLVINPLVETMSERFRVDGVDTVLTVDGVILNVLRGLELIDYRPRIVGNALNTARGYIRDETVRDLSVLEGAVLGGIAEQRIWWDDPEIQKCVELIEGANPGLEIFNPYTRPPDEPENLVSVYAACQEVELFARIAAAAGPELTYATFVAGAYALGEFDLPGSGPTSFEPGKADGGNAVYLYFWDDSEQDLISDGVPL
ncbi:MAG: branched-chain amino acid transport system substrate-binding protein [Candidatus Aldehydirespiratoraceae bacterium]